VQGASKTDPKKGVNTEVCVPNVFLMCSYCVRKTGPSKGVNTKRCAFMCVCVCVCISSMRLGVCVCARAWQSVVDL
jgi:hypothetical protein